MAADKPQFTLTIPSDLAHVACARTFVVAVCQSHGFDASAADAFALAVHEALNNVIRHAHQHRAEVPLEVRCFCVPRAWKCKSSTKANPSTWPACRLDPAELRPGGRGIFLMRALTDELSCHPRESRGNVLRLVKRRGCNSGPETPP